METTEKVAANLERQAKTKKNVQRLVNLATELNQLIAPGASIQVNIRTGKVVDLEGIPQSDATALIISKPIIQNTFNCTVGKQAPN